MSELNQANPFVVMIVAVLILLGRVFHAYAFLKSKEHLLTSPYLRLLQHPVFWSFNFANRAKPTKYRENQCAINHGD